MLFPSIVDFQPNPWDEMMKKFDFGRLFSHREAEVVARGDAKTSSTVARGGAGKTWNWAVRSWDPGLFAVNLRDDVRDYLCVSKNRGTPKMDGL